MRGSYGPFGLNTMLPLKQNTFMNTQLPFLATLKLPDLSKLTNDPILHHPSWPPLPVNIPTDLRSSKAKWEMTLPLTLPLIICGVSPTPCWTIQLGCIFFPVL